MHVIPVGPRAVLVEVHDAVAAVSLATWARTVGVVAEDIVPGAASVLFDGADPGAVREAVGAWARDPHPVAGAVPGAEVRIEVTYDGPDLDVVAAHWGCTVDEAVARHTSLELVSAFCGFAPGFAYLAGLPAEWAVPRLPSPRPRLRAGSVALADVWCAVYPSGSPGGWRVVGSTTATLWDVGREPPALLAPGTRVRFVAA